MIKSEEPIKTKKVKVSDMLYDTSIFWLLFCFFSSQEWKITYDNLCKIMLKVLK